MTNEEQRYLGLVARLGCAICRRLGFPDTPAEVHHRRTGTGAGRRASHYNVIPLCPFHHRGDDGIHGMGRRAWEAGFGVTELELIEETALLVEELERRNVAWRG